MSLNWEKLSRDRQLSLKARIVPENDDELYDYIRFFWGIEFPRKAYCPHCTPPFQVLSDCYFARYRTALLKASRGCGKSSLLATLTLTELISLNTEIMILGASQVQSLKILEYIKGDTTRFEGCFWDSPNAPKWLLNEKEYLKEEIWTIPNQKGISGNIKCFTASPKSVRGQRPLRLRCLTGDTAVHTPSGLRRLDTMRLGDEVLSFDGTKFVSAKVSRFLNNGTRDYYNVELSNGNTIKATGNHKLLTKEGWLTVDEIAASGVSELVGLNKTLITRVTPAGRARVYDLTVPGYSCFVAEGVVVHNCDEVDEADQQLIEDALGCPRDNPKLGLKANTLLSSTHQHVDGTLTHYIDRFSEANRQAGKIVAPIYTFCFKDLLTTNGGYLDPDEMEGLRATVSERTWLTEYLNGEPPRDQLMFSKEDLDFMFDPNLGVFAGANGEDCSLEQVNDDYVEYAIGSDWAKKKDMTVFCALAANPNPEGPDVLVGAMCMNKIPWPDMVARYDEFFNRFSPGMGFHDITGNSHLEDLIECDSEPFLFTSKSKKSVVDALIIAIQQHKIKCPKIASMEKEFRSLDFAKCYGEKHLPDWVAALALAWKARQVLNPINIDII